jgi:hypothetical protein
LTGLGLVAEAEVFGVVDLVANAGLDGTSRAFPESIDVCGV